VKGRKISGFFYKICKTNGEVYIQIWERTENGNRFVRSCGTAEKLCNNLVRLDSLKELTKKTGQNLTKISEGKDFEND
jgi:predicted nucleic acid-binding OB-fold protein